MKIAKIFKTGEIISAQDIADGRYSRDNDFVDVEEEFSVRYWKGAKNNGVPHFKLYLSKEDYKRLSPEQIERYKILCNMRHLEDSMWHREWEDAFSSFAQIEKHIKNPITNKYKIADAYYEGANVEIEFQHSYIAHDFEDRNLFYDEIGIDTIWLYDLTSSDIVEDDLGFCWILEDNSKGFFRVAENPDNLMKQNVFIQAKDNLIYHINKLERKRIDNELKSTIRGFMPLGIYTQDQFISMIKNKKFSFMKAHQDPELKTIWELWKKNYYWMAVEDTETKKQIIIFQNPTKNGWMRTGTKYKTLIQYQYITWKDNKYILNSPDYFHISQERANKRIWKLLRGFTDFYFQDKE